MTHDDPIPAALRALPSGWEVWRGVSGAWYARRRLSSPPIVYRAMDPGELAAKVSAYEAGER